MEGQIMSNVLNQIKNLITRITKKSIVCPCGYTAKSDTEALDHLNTHPAGIGSIDGLTGAVSW